MHYLGVILALSAAFMQAVSYIMLKKGMQEFKSSLAYMIDAFSGMLLWTPLMLAMGASFDNLSVTLPYAFVSAAIAEAFAFYVLQHGKLALTGTLLNSYPVFTILFSRFINQEFLNTTQIIAILLIVTAIIIASFPEKKSDTRLNALIMLPILAAIGIGFSDSLSKNIIDQISSADFLLALGIAQVPTSLLFAQIEKQPISELIKVVSNPRKYYLPLIGSVVMVVSMTFFWFAFGNIPASIASPLSATSPILIALLAPPILGEKLNFKDKVVIALGILGIIGINRT